MSTPAPGPGSFSALSAALTLTRSRRAALVERIALAMHDAVAAEGVGFDAARAAATSVADATAAQLEGNEAGSAVLALNRWALEAIDSGISLGVVVAAMHAGVGAVVPARTGALRAMELLSPAGAGGRNAGVGTIPTGRRPGGDALVTAAPC